MRLGLLPASLRLPLPAGSGSSPRPPLGCAPHVRSMERRQREPWCWRWTVCGGREGQRRQEWDAAEGPQSPYLKEEAQHKGQRPETEAGAYLLGVDTLVRVQALLLLHPSQLWGEWPRREVTCGAAARSWPGTHTPLGSPWVGGGAQGDGPARRSRGGRTQGSPGLDGSAGNPWASLPREDPRPCLPLWGLTRPPLHAHPCQPEGIPRGPDTARGCWSAGAAHWVARGGACVVVRETLRRLVDHDLSWCF